MSSTNGPGLKTSEAARILGQSPNTLRSWEERLGFPAPRRTEGGHRRFDSSEIRLLATLLDQGLSIGSAMEHIQQLGEGPKIELKLARAFKEYDAREANSVMEELLAVESLEKAVNGTLLPSAREVGQASDFGSANWSFTFGWATDWMKRASALAPDAYRGHLLIGDANNGEASQDALDTTAFELFTRRLGFEVINVAVEQSRGISDLVAQTSPVHSVIAGQASDTQDISRWAYAIGSQAGRPVDYAFHLPLSDDKPVQLPDDPHQASQVLA